jgi:Ras GTPase-activating-like protein IQGAP2/3
MEFGDDNPCFLPVNDFVNNAVNRVSAWLIEGEYIPFITLLTFRTVDAFCSLVANVPDVETQYHAHEFLDATVQPKPIEISPNEVYSIHRTLSDHLDQLASIYSDKFNQPFF